MENTATTRQRWALYCITKKDYRNIVLSKEEAAKMIQELGDKNYRKKPKDLKSELIQYFKDNFDRLYNNFLNEIGYKSILESDIPDKNGNKKRWAFVGCGCGLTWLKYNKNNKKAEEIDKIANEIRDNEILQMIIKKLPKKDYNYFKKIGCPIEAIWYQMQNLQYLYYSFIREFAKSKGIILTIESHLD